MEETKISVLRYPDNVRLRKGMYLSSKDQCVFEIVDNAVDEYAAGYCDTIHVTMTLDSDNEYKVKISDNGRGIPTKESDDSEWKGYSQAEVAMLSLHAGGKFGSSAEGSYKTSTSGMNGVGASCVNAVSTEFGLTIYQNSHIYSCLFSKGKSIKRLETIGTTKETGTTVEFKLDKDIWHEEEYDISHIKRRLRQIAYLNSGLQIIFCLNENGQENVETYHYTDGLHGYVEKITKGKAQLIPIESIHKQITYDSPQGTRDATVDIAFTYTDSYNSDIKSFVNNVATELGGDHEIGLKHGISNAIKKYIDEYKPKGVKNIEMSDTLEGITAIISLKMLDPNFRGQDKSYLKQSEIRKSVKDFVENFMYDYLSKDEKRAKNVLDKINQACKAREASKRARNAVRGVKNAMASSFVEDLAQCTCKDPEQCEIYFVEGNSAAGTAKQARNRKFQAILPVFGKILNAEKATKDKIVSSSKLIDMVRSLGCGIDTDFDMTKLKYHRIILLADADVDGYHIQCLHMTNFVRMMKPIVENGYLYAACPPLFKATKGKEHKYFYDKEELAKADTEGWLVSRFKGLGEMNPEELWETTMNPETRLLKRIDISDMEDTEESITLCMGKDAAFRKEFILNDFDKESELD